jgi:Na+-driven multidrug efflux pump
MSVKEFFKGFKKGMGLFGEGIATIVNSLLLAFVYFIGVGITSLVAKLVGKHFLEMKRSRKIETYWTDLHLKKKSEEEYYKQY